MMEIERPSLSRVLCGQPPIAACVIGARLGTTIRDRHVSHLRCSEFLLPPFPVLTGWATFCRASGAPALSRSIGESSRGNSWLVIGNSWLGVSDL